MLQKGNFNIRLLSVIVPAYRQESTIVKDITNMSQALNQLGLQYEIIIVVDGMIDKTHQQVLKIRSKNIKVIGYKKNQGKGQAIRHGMLYAKGDVIGFIDAGMDIHPAGFRMLLNHMEWYNAHIIVGSKLHAASKVNYPKYRTILSWGYRLLTWLFFGFKVKDTQVGLKFFKKNVVKDVFPRLLVKRYAFDIEMLAVAHALGYTRIYEAPVKITFKNNSIISKTLWQTISLMIWDTVAVFYRLKILHYYTKKQAKKKLNIHKKKVDLLLNLNK